MIKILNAINKTDKRAAEQIKDSILELWPDLENDKESIVQLHCSTQTPAGKVRDIDLTIIINFPKPKTIKPTWIKDVDSNYRSLEEIQVNNLCMTVEVKPQDSKNIKIIDGNLFVEYNGIKHNVVEQSSKQSYALKQSFGYAAPFVTRLIYLMSARENDFPKTAKPQFCACMRDSTFGDIIQIAMTQKAPLLKNNSRTAVFESGKELLINKALDSEMFKTVEVSRLTKQKVEQITKSAFRNNDKWKNDLGKKQIILRGRGGTGKTYQMLSWAYEEYIENNKRSLFITYNHALKSNLRVLIDAMDRNEGGSGTDIVTIQALMSKIAKLLKMKLTFDPDRTNYQKDLWEIYNAITCDVALPTNNPKYSNLWKKIINTSLTDELAHFFSADFVFIDEGQDVKPAEGAIIQLIFGIEKVIVSHGIDQYTRDFFDVNYENLDFDWSWGEKQRNKINEEDTLLPKDILNKSTQESHTIFHNLTKVMRLSENLNSVNEVINDKLNLPDLSVRPSDSLLGGNVVVYEGNLLENDQISKKIFKDTLSDGCKNSDILFCVNPAKNNKERLQNYFETKEIPFWDGTNRNVRQDQVPLAEQARIINYQSSRGLEGWSVVCLDFEGFWEKIYKHAINEEKSNKQLSLNLPELNENSLSENVRMQLRNWLMIPLTRPIKTIYIEIESKESMIGEILYKTHKELDEIVEWKEA
tara:strand:- start:436 stop:2529 length:2094 start_codon:yes stop_codon:yes gene_type:complete